MPTPEQLTDLTLRLARQAGFARAAVTSADPLGPCDTAHLEAFLAAGLEGQMAYLARHREIRLDPRKLLSGARSVVCLAWDYRLVGSIDDPPAIARFARGRDYHKILKRQTHHLADALREHLGPLTARACVDTAPLLERALAQRAGLGWIGLNHCLTVPGLGSYVLLAELITDLPLAPTPPRETACDQCGQCTAACPTGCFRPDGLLDARRCLSYLTIEHRGPIPRELWPLWGPRLAGCDACQVACPHNRPPGQPQDGEITGAYAEPSEAQEPLAEPIQLREVLGWTPADWDAATRGRSLRRIGYEQFLRNAVLAAGATRRADLAQHLKALARRNSSLAPEIRWALGRFDG